MDDEEYRDWAELPPEITSSILVRVGAIDILENAQKVCTSWRRVCKDPSMWRKIDMHLWEYEDYNPRYLQHMRYIFISMCRQAINRSQGGLVEIDLWDLGTDDLLKFMADRSGNLKSLRLTCCSQITDQGFVSAFVKLPLLENLEMLNCLISGEALKVLGQSCPNMKTLKVKRLPLTLYESVGREDDDDALAIAETMPGLHHLQLFGNALTDTGLNSILDNCPNLEHLDLRMCFNVNFVGDMQKRCVERVKVVIPPSDWVLDFVFDNDDGYASYSFTE